MNRVELVTKLEIVSRALSDNDLVPIFKCFCFDGKNVSAYNDAIGIVAECQTDEAFAVNGQTLLGLLKNSQGEEVTLHLEDEDTVVKAGKSTFRLPYQIKDEFLFVEPDLEEFNVKLLPVLSDMLKGMEACLLTSSRDTTQTALMGLCLSGGSIFYSCDGDALSRYTTPFKANPKIPSFILPNSFCEAVIKTASDSQSEVTSIILNKDWAKATLASGYVIYGRLIETDTPLDHEAEIKNTLKLEPTFVKVPAGLNEALSRARVVADHESAKTVFTIKGGWLRLLTDTHTGVVRDTIAMKHSEIEVNVSAALIQRAISLCDEMAVLENCCAFRSGEQLLQVLGNMD